MSRASSVSTNNKSSIGKRKQNAKQRREHSDSFDSRHHYAPYWSSQQQPWVPQQIPQQPYGVPYPMNVPYAGQPQPAYPAQNAPVYTAQNPPYPPPPNMAPGSQYPTYPVAQVRILALTIPRENVLTAPVSCTTRTTEVPNWRQPYARLRRSCSSSGAQKLAARAERPFVSSPATKRAHCSG